MSKSEHAERVYWAVQLAEADALQEAEKEIARLVGVEAPTNDGTPEGMLAYATYRLVTASGFIKILEHTRLPKKGCKVYLYRLLGGDVRLVGEYFCSLESVWHGLNATVLHKMRQRFFPGMAGGFFDDCEPPKEKSAKQLRREEAFKKDSK